MFIKRLPNLLILSLALCAVVPFYPPRLKPKRRNVHLLPAPGDRWVRRRAENSDGFGAADLAVAFAKTQEAKFRDFSTQVENFAASLARCQSHAARPTHHHPAWLYCRRWARPPISIPLTAWPDFLSTLCGLAVDRGLIKSVHDPVKQYATDDGYASTTMPKSPGEPSPADQTVEA